MARRQRYLSIITTGNAQVVRGGWWLPATRTESLFAQDLGYESLPLATQGVKGKIRRKLLAVMLFELVCMVMDITEEIQNLIVKRAAS